MKYYRSIIQLDYTTCSLKIYKYNVNTFLLNYEIINKKNSK